MAAPTAQLAHRPAPGRRGPDPAPPRRQPAVPAPRSPHTAPVADLIARGAPADGDRAFRTRDGRVVELPEGMTPQEAARLEAEALAAAGQARGPAPLPPPQAGAGPDPRAPARPEAAGPRRPRPAARGGQAAGARRAPPPSPSPAFLPLAGAGPVARYLAARGTPVLAAGLAKLRRQGLRERHHDSARDKLRQAEQAVREPPDEGQARSNSAQVERVGARPPPVVDARVARGRLDASLAAHTPRSVEDVDNFKDEGRAARVAQEVLAVVRGDAGAVSATFADLGQTPAPLPAASPPRALPPEEAAPPTPPMTLGRGAIAPLAPEHADLGRYPAQAEARLQEEGITQAQLDMVDSGDLAEAKREKQGMERTAREAPGALRQFAAEETRRVDRELEQAEQRQRGALKAKRGTELGATGRRRLGAREDLERKREEVARRINAIHQGAQERVKRQLAALESASLRRFDAGNAGATQAFQDGVERDLAAYKAERYSGWFGWARKAKDWLLGMDELPGVKRIFASHRARFVGAVNQLVEDISADGRRVIQACRGELEQARRAIRDYVAGLGPALRGIGQRAARDMDARLDALDRFVTAQEQALGEQLKARQRDAIKAIDARIEKMKEAMSGALAKLGRLLLWAAKKFFTWALGKFGYALGTIESIIDRGVAVLKAIFTQPIRFVGNLVRAAATGFANFRERFLTHLKDALFTWLTGALEGVRLPQSWDLKGILGVALELVGLTWGHIRARLVRMLGEPAVGGLERGFDLVRALATRGPMAAWERLRENAEEVRVAFLDALRAWVRDSIIRKAVETLLALFVPGAGIIRAVVGIYDTIVFFIQRARQIARMVGDFLGSMAEIAAGNIGAAANALEAGLARALALVIDFLARFLRLGGITQKIRTALERIRGRVDGALDRVAAWVADKARRSGRFLRRKAGEVFSWAFARTHFADAEGARHTLYIQGEATPRLMIASTPMAAEAFLDWYLERRGPDFRRRQAARVTAVREAIGAVNAAAAGIARLKENGAPWQARQGELLELNVRLSGALADLIGEDRGLGDTLEKYRLEGLTGTYGSMPKPPGDDFTADHQPQAAILTAAAQFRFFTRAGELVERAAGRAKAGYAINLHKTRHAAGATYGAKGKATKESFLEDVKPLVKDKPAAEQRREVVRLIRRELSRDVAAMKQVVAARHDTPIWKDVTDRAGSGRPGRKLVAEIRARILAGEDQLANQDLDALAS